MAPRRQGWGFHLLKWGVGAPRGRCQPCVRKACRRGRVGVRWGLGSGVTQERCTQGPLAGPAPGLLVWGAGPLTLGRGAVPPCGVGTVPDRSCGGPFPGGECSPGPLILSTNEP